MSTLQYPVTQLNYTAMKSLLDEGRSLRKQLDQEKAQLQSNIDRFLSHIQKSEFLQNTGKISPNLFNKVKDFPSFFENFDPSPSIRKSDTLQFDDSDISEQSSQIIKQIDEIESQIVMLGNERSTLAIQEQKASAQQTAVFEESIVLREQCDELLQQRDLLEHEQQEYQDLLEFWRSNNQKLSSVLDDSIYQLKSAQNMKDADSIRLMQELSTIYTQLDAASRKLRVKSF
ncbi:hypothetical protein TVAG_321060 [Trichomonas vaginalis G3]|uniref:Uncharacterized protein n=1 Tax=Trichomonas vaginalis (strain ATCC PRA-98 / G3) TaxID=412133 RepID=A2F814_TRIV3|nr:hypothetical protein TVAGG3_0383950 [Trichomonas vaginalis G3]EAX98946.1 hypothetical protein TVAG_321060 [Trichomonas vaginalis G3]KAI5533488.1 hypothetical protein TVAGG3_0383950 [Trichomonas vaginalis G3]|eukprot:XP_001311876.1 hypothetical protein [Trichomonas vaginalis G3]